MDKLAIVLGTRPEIIKLSPIIRECFARRLDFIIIHSGQHYSSCLDRIFFNQLKLPLPDYSLEVGSADSASNQTGEIIIKCGKVLNKEKPDIVLVQGDTNTTLGGAIAAVKSRTKVGHIEAGLRSYDLQMPEEVNRMLVDHCSNYLFTPTTHSRDILIKEGISSYKITVTGNTIVDAVFQNLKLAKSLEIEESQKNFILLTIHRQENVDNRARFQSILQGIGLVGDKLGLRIIFPIHPRSRKMLKQLSIKLPQQIVLIEPQDYLSFLHLLSSAKLVITDSGGVQEEACIIGRPCVTVRDNTERPETVMVGANIIAGTRKRRIFSAVKEMLSRDTDWRNPFGNGNAASKTIDFILKNEK